MHGPEDNPIFRLQADNHWYHYHSRIPPYPQYPVDWEALQNVAYALRSGKKGKVESHQLGIHRECLYIAERRKLKVYRWHEIEAFLNTDQALVIRTRAPLKSLKLPPADDATLDALNQALSDSDKIKMEDSYNERLFRPEPSLSFAFALVTLVLPLLLGVLLLLAISLFIPELDLIFLSQEAWFSLFFYGSGPYIPFLCIYLNFRYGHPHLIYATSWGLLFYNKDSMKDAIAWADIERIEKKHICTVLHYRYPARDHRPEQPHYLHGRRRLLFICGQEYQNLLFCKKHAEGKMDEISRIPQR